MEKRSLSSPTPVTPSTCCIAGTKESNGWRELAHEGGMELLDRHLAHRFHLKRLVVCHQAPHRETASPVKERPFTRLSAA